MAKKHSIQVNKTVNKLNPTEIKAVTSTSSQPTSIETNSIPSVKPRRRRRSIIREFALNTSTHGLPGIARSESKHNQLFWKISFLVFTGVMVYFIVRTVSQYLQYSTQTSVSIALEQNPRFPAVTFCNFYPFRSDRLLGPFFRYTDAKNITRPNQNRTLTPFLATILRQYLLQKLNKGESIEESFFTLEMMMISCTFNDIACSKDDFVSFESANHGLCYTFNARQKNSTDSMLRQVLQYGGPGRLNLQLYAHTNLYVPFAAQGKYQFIKDSKEISVLFIVFPS